MKKEWVVMQCLDAFQDAQGNKGEHKIPVPGYDTPMTKEEALQALEIVEQKNPGLDFSIRRMC